MKNFDRDRPFSFPIGIGFKIYVYKFRGHARTYQHGFKKNEK